MVGLLGTMAGISIAVVAWLFPRPQPPHQQQEPQVASGTTGGRHGTRNVAVGTAKPVVLGASRTGGPVVFLLDKNTPFLL